jgi:predicted O-methyltransferase YrrM
MGYILSQTMNALPEVLLQAFQEKTVFNGAGARVPMHSNVSEEECRRLHETVRAIRPAVSAEVGFAQGASTLAILQALHDNGAGMHHVIDPFQARFENCGLAMVERAGLGGRMQFYQKFAEEVLPSLPRLQFVFIDASHLFDLTLCEFVLADKRLDVGGVIGFHDLWMPSLRKLVRYILRNRAYEVYGNGGEAGARGGFLANAARSAARRLQGGRHIFSREFLEPWTGLGLANMVVVRKTADDAREWDYHAEF